MDPNSQHQIWSKWTITVRPGAARPSFETVRTNSARFMRKAFGSAATMRVRQFTHAWVFEVLTEGLQIHDERLVEHYSQSFAKFFENGFGVGTRTLTKMRLMAGARPDRRPPDQLLILPAFDWLSEAQNGKRAL